MYAVLLSIIKIAMRLLLINRKITSILPVSTAGVLIGVISLLNTGLETTINLQLARLSLITLRCWLTPLYCLLNSHPINQDLFTRILGVILVILIARFRVTRTMSYFFFFEAILIPTYILILGWGYQPERLTAATIIFFYTMTASLPLLGGLVALGNELGSTDYIVIELGRGNLGMVITAILLLAFLVKFPVYLGHL